MNLESLSLDFLNQQRTELGNWKQVASNLGVTEKKLRLYRKGLGDSCVALVPSLDDTPVADSASMLKLHKKVRKLTDEKLELNRLLNESLRTENVLDEVQNMLLRASEPLAKRFLARSDRITPVFKKTGKKGECDLILYIADWHFGEIVRLDQVGGVNEYNPVVAAARLKRTALVTAQWIQNYHNICGVRKVIICLMGDNISGMHNIHPEQADEACRIAVQVLDMQVLLAQTIEAVTSKALSVGAEVEVYATGPGNHARSTRKMPRGIAALETSWETLLNHGVAGLLRGLPITWSLATGYSNSFSAGDKRFCIAHGDAISGGLSSTSMKKHSHTEILKSLVEARLKSDPSLIVGEVRTGHFHEDFKMQIPGGKFRVVPSGKGTDAWVFHDLGKDAPPEQLIEVLHPVYGLMGEHPIDLRSVNVLDGFLFGQRDIGDQPIHAILEHV